MDLPLKSNDAIKNMIAAQNRPDVKAKKSKSMIACYKSLSQRAETSTALKKYWKNPEARIKASITQKIVQNNPKVRLKRSIAAKKAYSDLEVRAKMVAAMTVAVNKPEARLKKSIALKLAWKNPVCRAKHSGPNNPRWNPNRKEVFTPYTEDFFNKNYRQRIWDEQQGIDPITGLPLLSDAHLHHVNYKKNDSSRKNLIYLNHLIHLKTNGSSINRTKWKRTLAKINRIIIDR
jgi:hypothetical protein